VLTLYTLPQVQPVHLVFVCWPGQTHSSVSATEPAKAHPTTSERLENLQIVADAAAAEVCARTEGARSLCYATLMRPVRQGRLQLALEEVLLMQDDSAAASESEDDYWHSADALGGLLQAAGGSEGDSRWSGRSGACGGDRLR
jgi:hypothetical protein